ncbi:Uncharacterised protein [Actinomyces bovis]|uniref:ABC-2 family transporter protein n=1 Tax=Actinomyces bovis TaxID=1658 RepID=A0ABY1VTS2_9ACTO|nr:hypothetical protein [Actinomyces bovis]SPT54433.1 Uncharacterised protein [Actinomyces bovis]VEG55972.1 Uncharacterised protein [Actinomyces israelii]
MSVYTLATSGRPGAGLGASPGIDWRSPRTHRPIAALVHCYAADRFWAWLLAAALLPTFSLSLLAFRPRLPLLGVGVSSRVLVGMELMMLAEAWGATRVTNQFRDGTVTSSVAQHRGLAHLALHHAFAVLPGSLLLAAAGASSATICALALEGLQLEPTLLGSGYWASVLGLLVVAALAAPIGISVGWVLRDARSCALLIVAWALAVRPLLDHLLPEAVVKSLPLGLSSLLLQATGPEASTVLAALLLLTWTVVLTTASILLTRGRDLRA